MNKRVIFILSTFLLLFIAVFLIWIQPELKLYLFEDQKNSIGYIIQFLYPQIEYYKTKYDTSLLFDRANQLIYRSIFLFLLAIICILKKDKFNNILEDHQLNKKSTSPFIFIYSIFALYSLFDWSFEITNISRLHTFYTPLFPIKFISQSLPSTATLYSLIGLGTFSSVLLLTPINLKIKALLSVFLIISLITIHSTFCSFGKIDHGYASFFYAGFILPVYFWTNNLKYIRVSQIAVTTCYFLAGLEKVFLSGFNFLHPIHFKQLLYLHPTTQSNWLMQYNFLCTLLPLFTILIQLGAPIVFLKQQLLPYWLAGAVLFHWGAYFFMGVGGYHSPWVFALSVFIPSLFQKTK